MKELNDEVIVFYGQYHKALKKFIEDGHPAKEFTPLNTCKDITTSVNHKGQELSEMTYSELSEYESKLEREVFSRYGIRPRIDPDSKFVQWKDCFKEEIASNE
jgi:hypothetical protein